MVFKIKGKALSELSKGFFCRVLKSFCTSLNIIIIIPKDNFIEIVLKKNNYRREKNWGNY